MYLDVLREEISQGDVFPDIEVIDHSADGATTRRAALMLLSPDCEFDKLAVGSGTEHALMVEVRDGAENLGLWGDIHAGRVWNALDLGDGPIGERPFLDYRRVYRIHKATLIGARDTRTVSLSEEGQRTTVYGLASFLLRIKIGEP